MASNSLLSQTLKIYNDIQTIYKLKQSVKRGIQISVINSQ